MDQDIFDLICLFDPNADSYTVHAWFYTDLFILVTGDGQRVEEDFWRTGSFDFGDVMTF